MQDMPLHQSYKKCVWVPLGPYLCGHALLSTAAKLRSDEDLPNYQAVPAQSVSSMEQMWWRTLHNPMYSEIVEQTMPIALVFNETVSSYSHLERATLLSWKVGACLVET